MNLWETLKRKIGTPLKTIYFHRGEYKEYNGILRKVDDCLTIDYGSDYMDFNFVDAQYIIHQLIDSDGTIIYNNPKVEDYYNNFTCFNDVIDERYEMFKQDYIDKSLKLKDKYLYNTIKYSDKFRSEFSQAVNNPINNLSYWYPLISDIGFKTPKTETYELTEEITEPLIRFINSKQTDLFSEDFIDYQTNLLNLITSNTKFLSNQKLFIKSGVFSNKFNFETCQVDSLTELPLKFYQIFKRELQQARGIPPKEIVLREFIQTNNKRKTIYNGMPLNTEFRVFYDFNKHKVLGIENYWNPIEMEDGLTSNEDINNYLDEKQNIINEFKKLKPILTQECDKLKHSTLRGNWSIDFMWDGKEFVLIDMALAECSSYWEKYQHLADGGIDISKINIPEGVLPKKVVDIIEDSKQTEEKAR